eukprot:CAMPEP_0184688684 /NCGR_PEP_ID=MMETSP0312-20130426/30232_1 /TAXON_ID=31354 /ORGANISM="Compsopogon coeruleus, Strain SAG 36.94" /LENGTH=430 /DNA_ID=CAMNT_0027145943 /DNA_START=86 /DNA_END=1375 /DNA_ORIENTATION=-
MEALDIASDVVRDAYNRQGSVRGLLYDVRERCPNERVWRRAYAVAMEASKYAVALWDLLGDEGRGDGVFQGRDEWEGNEGVILVQLYERLFGGKGTGTEGQLGHRLGMDWNEMVNKVVKRAEEKYGGLDQLREFVHGNELTRWRYARVNALRGADDDQIVQELAGAGYVLSESTVQESHETPKTCWKDSEVPHLYRFHFEADLFHLHLVRDCKLIIQDKGSCFAALAMDPDPSWTIVDACAAPGSKTLHLADLLHRRNSNGHIRKAIFALDKDARRVEILRARVQEAKALSWVSVAQGDFLNLPSKSERMVQRADAEAKALSWVSVAQGDFLNLPSKSERMVQRADAILLDPSCSGSGLSSRNDVALTDAAERKSRLESLSNFQRQILRRALLLEKARRVVYSTCSVFREENEDVVRDILQDRDVLDARW